MTEPAVNQQRQPARGQDAVFNVVRSPTPLPDYNPITTGSIIFEGALVKDVDISGGIVTRRGMRLLELQSDGAVLVAGARVASSTALHRAMLVWLLWNIGRIPVGPAGAINVTGQAVAGDEAAPRGEVRLQLGGVDLVVFGDEHVLLPMVSEEPQTGKAVVQMFVRWLEAGVGRKLEVEWT